MTVTRDIDPADAADLLEKVPRACLAFAGAGGLEAEPVACVCREGRYLVGIPAGRDLPRAGEEAVLLIDEGVYFFDLRAVYVRGTVHATEPPDDGRTSAEQRWFEVAPTKIVAWDYGEMREVEA